MGEIRLSATAEVKPPPTKTVFRTAIARSTSANRVLIAISGAAVLDLLSQRTAELRESLRGLNSNESRTAVEIEIEKYHNLELLIIAFLKASDGLVDEQREETQVVETAISFARGVRNWWNRDHITICEKAFDRGAFLTALSVCLMAGAGGPLATIAAGSLVVGKPFCDAILAKMKASDDK